MKFLTKALFALVMMLCLLILPLAASAEEAAPLNLMPVDESGYSVVEGDGTVAVEDGKLVITNNGDDDFRVLIHANTNFDLTSLNALHMQFHAEMPFKMAYHLIAADTSSDWLTTTTDFNDLYEIDYLTDRNPLGEYDIKMDLNTAAVEIMDASAVYYDQFIILVTGKGTFTLQAVEMIADEVIPPAEDTPVDEEPATDEPEATATKSTTATTKSSSSTVVNAMPLWLLIVILVVVVVAVAVCIVIVLKRRAA